jgi:hypothetical protein
MGANRAGPQQLGDRLSRSATEHEHVTVTESVCKNDASARIAKVSTTNN